MKFSWGTGIAIAYSLFAGAMILLVIKSRSVDRSLVVDNYYAEDLNYQEQYDKMQNTLDLEEGLRIELSEKKDALTLIFPQGMGAVSGEVEFYNPAFKARDFRVVIRLDDARSQTISLLDLRKGRWKVKIDWKAGGKGYYQEKDLFL